MDRIISERGVERFDPPPRSEAPKKTARKAKPTKAAQTGKPRAKQRHPHHQERRQLLRAFDLLEAADQVAQAEEFRRRLRLVSTSDADCEHFWSSAFGMRLRFLEIHGRTFGEKRRSGVRGNDPSMVKPERLTAAAIADMMRRSRAADAAARSGRWPSPGNGSQRKHRGGPAGPRP
jgi:hypothetical protein